MASLRHIRQSCQSFFILLGRSVGAPKSLCPWTWKGNEEIPGQATPLSYCATCTRTARCSRARMLRKPWMALTGCSWGPRWLSSSIQTKKVALLKHLSRSCGFRQIDQIQNLWKLWWVVRSFPLIPNLVFPWKKRQHRASPSHHRLNPTHLTSLLDRICTGCLRKRGAV